MSERILITGGAGFIGSHLADAALASGAEVCVVDDLSSGSRDNLQDVFRFEQVDIRDRDALERVMLDFKPTCVSHQAAQASVSVSVKEPNLDAAINIQGGLNVLTLANDVGAEHFLFASTGGAIYGEVPENQAADESWLPKPASPYAISKYAFEHYMRALWTKTATVLRYANVYGVRQNPHGEAGVVAIFSERLAEGKPCQIFAKHSEGDDGCIRDYVNVSDVANAHELARSKRLDGIFNVGTGVGRTTLDVYNAVAKATGVKATAGRGPQRAGDLQRSVLSAKKIRELGWKAETSFGDGIASVKP